MDNLSIITERDIAFRNEKFAIKRSLNQRDITSIGSRVKERNSNDKKWNSTLHKTHANPSYF